jgi:hypothetical protein
MKKFKCFHLHNFLLTLDSVCWLQCCMFQPFNSHLHATLYRKKLIKIIITSLSVIDSDFNLKVMDIYKNTMLKCINKSKNIGINFPKIF